MSGVSDSERLHQLAQAVQAWWTQHQHTSTGQPGTSIMPQTEPAFVTLAKAVLAEVETPATSRGKDPATANGWFDVEAYRTQEQWTGPDEAETLLDGFLTLEGAIAYADSPEFAEYYQVVVVAYGQHADYEPGERVYYRFTRPETD